MADVGQYLKPSLKSVLKVNFNYQVQFIRIQVSLYVLSITEDPR